MTSARILGEDDCHPLRATCVFSRIQKGTPELTHKGCVLQRVSLGARSDITVVLGMRQSVVVNGISTYMHIPRITAYFEQDDSCTKYWMYFGDIQLLYNPS